MGSGGGGGGGNSALSFSSLSALAPPFTIDRSNPKPNPNPSSPFKDTWPYACPSVPTPELVIDSTEITSMPLSTDYQFSASLSSNSPSSRFSSSTMFSYGLEPYYSPSALPRVSEDYRLVEGNGPHFDVDYTCGKGESSQNHYIQNSYDLEYEPKWVDSLVFDDGKPAKRVELDGNFLKSTNAGGSHSYNNQLNRGGCAIEYKSKSKENIGFSYEKFNQDIDREFDTGCMSLVGRTVDKSCLDQNLSFLPYKSNKPHISTSSSSYSETRPCGGMLKNFPSYQNSSSTYEKSSSSVDSPFIDSVSVIRSSPTVVISPPLARSENVTGWHPKWKEPHVKKSNTEVAQDSDATDVKEFLSPLHSMDSFDRNTKARFGSQLPNINVTPDKESSESIDHQNPAVDSPCWKGAPPNTKTTFSEKAGDCSKNAENECAINKLEKTLDAIFSNREESSSDDANLGISTDDLTTPIKESSPPTPNNLKSGFHMKISDSIHLFGEEDISEVAVLAAEKVLASPASQEDEKLRCDPKLDAAIMIKTIHNLSELLLFQISNVACTLKEEDFETIKLIRCNLDSCMNEKIDIGTNEVEQTNLTGDSSKNLGDLGAISCRMHMINEAPDSKLDYPCMHEVKESCKKHEKFAILGDESDLTTDEEDDDMTKAIGKVLDKNFKYNEDMDSQALLFKRLWLEAEAKLCSINYKARFDRMRIEMGKSSKGNKDVALSERIPRAHDSIIPEKPPKQNSSFSNTVMARFNILKSREDNLQEEQHTNTVDGSAASSFTARLNILKSREGSLKEDLKPENGNREFYMKQKYLGPSIKQLSKDEGSYLDSFVYEESLKDPVMVENYKGCRENSSSDWEQVVLNLKDNFAWKNS